VQGSISEQEVQGGLPIVGELAPPVPLQIDINSALAARKVSVIKGIFLDQITLAITATDDPDGSDNFDFIQSIKMFATSGNNQDLPRVEIAEITHSADGSKTLVIPALDGVNLKDYVEAGMDIDSEVTASTPPTNLTFDGDVSVIVQAL